MALSAVAHQAWPDDLVIVGRLSGLYGVKGWHKVFSHTDPRDNILSYSPWYLKQGDEWKPYKLNKGRVHGKGIVAQLQGCDDRDQAQILMGQDIAVSRQLFARTVEGEFYWSDLVGLEVQHTDGEKLGKVVQMMETGANDVLVVRGERERLIPFLWQQVIKSVDTEAKVICVDWDKDF